MAFTGFENQWITSAEGSTLTQSYRSDAGNNAILGHYFSKQTLNGILAQEGCVGIRAYHGLSETGAKELVLVGVDSSENDLDQGLIADRSNPCPPNCGSASTLNS